MMMIRCCILLGLVATTLACTADDGKRCLGSSEVNSYFKNMFASGDPCFNYNGNKMCFTGQKGGSWQLMSCRCTNNGGGGGGSNSAEPDNEWNASGDWSNGGGGSNSGTSNKCDNSMIPRNYGWDTAPWCRVSKDHTGCRFNKLNQPECDNLCARGISDAGKDEIVAAHNRLRARVANGQESPQPSASNMNRLRWNDELAAVAQLWADQCTYEHDKDRSRSSGAAVGQNLAINMNSRHNPQLDLSRMIQGWYDEVKDMPTSVVGRFSSSGGRNGAVIGHYTQLVWAQTTEVGCGLAQWKDTVNPLHSSMPYQTMLVCNYGRAGNYRRQAVYKQGRAGSACSNGASGGLCN